MFLVYSNKTTLFMCFYAFFFLQVGLKYTCQYMEPHGTSMRSGCAKYCNATRQVSTRHWVFFHSLANILLIHWFIHGRVHVHFEVLITLEASSHTWKQQLISFMLQSIENEHLKYIDFELCMLQSVHNLRHTSKYDHFKVCKVPSMHALKYLLK